MWFKNCYVYQIDEGFDVEKEALKEGLEENSFRNIGRQEQYVTGWVSPYAGDHEGLMHDNGQCILIALRRDEKVIPSATVNEKINERKAEIEQREVRKVYRKEERRLRDEVIESLLPHAMFSSRVTLGYIDLKNGWVCVDSGSQRKAQEFTEQLRNSMGSLPITPLHSGTDMTAYMKSWITDKPPELFTIGDECELKSVDEAGTIKIKGHDVTHDDFINLMDDRVMVTKLALTFKEDIEFTLVDDASVRRLRFDDGIKEEAGHYDSEDYLGQFDADFSVMTLSLRELIKAMEEWVES